MSKVALVVDDSRVARHVLSELLADHGVLADTAESAEEALDYLKHSRPDVVFMDHMMPGMDGFEALEAIKANPATATIPVMMYTSQEGGLYVGQARALGAFGVLPKDLKPTEVATVLKALHLTTDESSGPPSTLDTAEDERADASPDQAINVEELIQALFNQQRAALRDEIRQGYQQAVDSVRVPVLSEVDIMPDKRASVVPWLALAFVILAAVVLGLLYVQTDRALVEERLRSTDLLEQVNQALEASRTVAAGAQSGTSEGGVPLPGTLMRVLEQAVAFDSQFGFGEVALSDGRAGQIESMVTQLETAGFSGTVFVDVHIGNFCTVASETGAPVLAPAEVSAADCSRRSNPEIDAAERAATESVGFANMVAAIEQRGYTTFQVNAHGASLPAVRYPQDVEFVSAGEWNAFAARNQRVELRFQQ